MPESQPPKVEIEQSGLRIHIGTTESGLSLVGWDARIRGIWLASLSCSSGLRHEAVEPIYPRRFNAAISTVEYKRTIRGRTTRCGRATAGGGGRLGCSLIIRPRSSVMKDL